METIDPPKFWVEICIVAARFCLLKISVFEADREEVIVFHPKRGISEEKKSKARSGGSSVSYIRRPIQVSRSPKIKVCSRFIEAPAGTGMSVN